MNKTKKFQRRIENFVCEKCGAKVRGNGYTDHCPTCLWGKHVDVNPGDRAASCKGMMEPVQAEVKGEKHLLYYKCSECGHQFRVKSAPEDNLDAIIKLINK
jgi:rubrerythrin